ncbi:hypothetical protein R84B8_02026 [Treponema sp. R8-4-B8]
MCMIIPLKSVVANAFIELRKKRSEENELLFDKMDAYRRKIIDLLAEEKNEIAAIPCSGNDVSEFLNEYSNLFKLEERNKRYYFLLKINNESVDKILMGFNAYLPLKFLAVVSSSKSTEPLFQAENVQSKIHK